MNKSEGKVDMESALKQLKMGKSTTRILHSPTICQQIVGIYTFYCIFSVLLIYSWNKIIQKIRLLIINCY